jgi:Ca-activated chloride channel family protein
MSALVWLRPGWLVALALIVLTALLLWRRDPERRQWADVIDPTLIGGLRAMGLLHPGHGALARRWLLATAALIALALAGPALPRANAPVFARSDAILLALDMSPSVTQSQALPQAQAAIAEILSAGTGRPIGLILFAADAYQVAAPTQDPRAIESLIAVLDSETMPDAGSHPARALALADQILQDLPRADLILLTDGGGMDESALAAAQSLPAESVRLSVVALDGHPEPENPRLDALRAPTVRPGNLAPLLTTLSRPNSLKSDPTLAQLQYRDLGPYLLLLALPLLLSRFRRRS